jgi:hypothetical protein
MRGRSASITCRFILTTGIRWRRGGLGYGISQRKARGGNRCGTITTGFTFYILRSDEFRGVAGDVSYFRLLGEEL